MFAYIRSSATLNILGGNIILATLLRINHKIPEHELLWTADVACPWEW